MTSEAQGSNVLNVTYTAYGLTKEVRNGSNQLMETFRYDDRGNRVAATTYDAGLPVKTTYYVSDANGSVMSIYDQVPNGTLRQIELPIYGSGRIGEYKPVSNKMFYELTDHLGNVRAVMGPSYTEAKTATLEISQANEDQSNFLRYQNAQFVNAAIFDHTHHVQSDTSSYSQRLTGATNDIYGLARSLNVMPGDTLNMEVYAKYVDPSSANWNGTLTTLMGLITSSVSSVVAEGTSFAASTSSFGLTGLLTHTDNGTGPKAYLNWLIFDKNYKFITGGFQQLTDAAKEDGTDVLHERVHSPAVVITQPGYAHIYLSNESSSPTEVYFDDFKVTQSHSVYVAGGDYYPFGLPITDRQMDAESYRFGYQGQFAEKDSLANWNRFQLRMYEPKFGRWSTKDPYGQFSSPYLGMGNQPISGIDANGGWLMPIDLGGVFLGAAAGAALGLVFDRKDWELWALGGAALGGFLMSDYAKVNIWRNFDYAGTQPAADGREAIRKVKFGSVSAGINYNFGDDFKLKYLTQLKKLLPVNAYFEDVVKQMNKPDLRGKNGESMRLIDITKGNFPVQNQNTPGNGQIFHINTQRKGFQIFSNPGFLRHDGVPRPIIRPIGQPSDRYKLNQKWVQMYFRFQMVHK